MSEQTAPQPYEYTFTNEHNAEVYLVNTDLLRYVTISNVARNNQSRIVEISNGNVSEQTGRPSKCKLPRKSLLSNDLAINLANMELRAALGRGYEYQRVTEDNKNIFPTE